MSHVIELDLGPESTIIGYATQVAGDMVCVLTPKATEDRAARERVRRYMTGQGRNCRVCRSCPVGTAD